MSNIIKITVKFNDTSTNFTVRSDKPASLKQLRSQFPQAIGLKFLSSDARETVLLVEGDDIYPDDGQWRTDVIYMVQYESEGTFLNSNEGDT